MRGFILGAWLVAISIGGCSDDHEDDHGPHDQPAECEEISDVCHGLDDGTPGLIHDCHTLGHDGTAEQCAAKLQECEAACGGASDAGTDSAADSSSAADAHAHD